MLQKALYHTIRHKTVLNIPGIWRNSYNIISLLHLKYKIRGQSLLFYRQNNTTMKRLRLGAVLHFFIAISHIVCLCFLDEAFEAYGIRDTMLQIVSGKMWMLHVLTICLVIVFTIAGLYALSAIGDIRRLPWTRTAIVTIVVLYSLRALTGAITCIFDFSWLQCVSSLIPALVVWCYWPGVKKITYKGEKEL